MSFILDALRKSEARRQMGEGPDLNRPPPGAGSTGRRRRGRSVLGIGMLLAAVVVFAGTAWIGRDLISGQVAQWTGSAPRDLAIPADRPLLADLVGPPIGPGDQALADDGQLLQPSHSDLLARAEQRRRDRQQPSGDEQIDRALPRERIVTDPEEIEAELARRMAEEQGRGSEEGEETSPTQRRRQAPMDPARVAEIERQVAEAERRRREMERESDRAEREAEEAARLARQTARPVQPDDSGESVSDTVVDTTQPWSPSASAQEYIRAWELPLSIRRNMPDLRLTIHVYSADEAQRFVLVNGERYVVGDQLGEGARLVDIRREGAVVDFRDYRFLLEP